MRKPFEWTITKSERFAAHLAVRFSSPALEGTGVVCDLCLSGARIETDVAVPLHEELKLALALPNQSGQLEIHFAVVRWVLGQHVGVEFMRLDTASFRQLVE